MLATGYSLVVTAMVVTTMVAVVSAEGSSSDESLRQALVLVDILKSAMLRRSQRRFAGTPNSIAGFTDYRPWTPLHEAPINGLSFRRVNGLQDQKRREDNNAIRQMEYEDPFSEHPGDEAPGKPEEVSTTAKASSLQPPKNDKDPSTTATIIIEATAAETKTIATTKVLSSPSSDNRENTNSNIKPKKSLVTSNAPAKRKTKKPTNLIGKSKKTNSESLKVTSKVSTVNAGGIIKLKYNKNSDTKDVYNSKRADEAEIAEAALELQREAADTGDVVHHRCATRSTHSGPLRTGAPQNEPQTPCVSSSCSETNATQVIKKRFKATPRIYLSRSFPPPLPLPANNAFCFTNPESALCRTMI